MSEASSQAIGQSAGALVSSESSDGQYTQELTIWLVRDVEFKAQITDAGTARSFRVAAKNRKDAMNVQRDVFLRNLEDEAERYNVDFYAGVLEWQTTTLKQVRNEMVNNLI